VPQSRNATDVDARERVSIRRRPWLWVPSLYFVQGLPYVVVVNVSVILYENLGLSNAQIAEYTSYLYLPWVIKPLWSPVVDVIGAKRRWIVNAQLLMSLGLFGLAWAVTADQFLYWTLGFFFLLAFSSATHDIAADGFYMGALSSHDQALFVGIRSTFYRLSMIAGSGLLVMVVGRLMKFEFEPSAAWRVGIVMTAVLLLAMGVYHAFVLPRPRRDQSQAPGSLSRVVTEIGDTFATFFAKKHLVMTLAFLLLYRFAEGQLVKIASPFLLDAREAGGLGLDNEQVGLAYGTVGVVLLVIGGILGGIAAARWGLRSCLPAMMIAMNLPNVVYLALACWQPTQLWLINAAVGIEQFGYGFGFAAYMLYMLYVARGEHETAHYALCTGFMALGMMIPGWISGRIQEALGYTDFFAWIMVATIPSFVVASIVFFQIDPRFGRREVA
jgi:MFS transporter, PAT family, beta-lactamase induction signal transducer AmpG